MRVYIYWTDPLTGNEHLQNVRDTDEIADDRGLTDDEADRMEGEIRTVGRYWLDADTCARRAAS